MMLADYGRASCLFTETSNFLLALMPPIKTIPLIVKIYKSSRINFMSHPADNFCNI